MSTTILSIALDTVGAAAAFDWKSDSREMSLLPVKFPPRDARQAVGLKSGAAIGTLVGEYVRELQAILELKIHTIAVSAPGTINFQSGVVLKSTRLGIHEAFNFPGFLRDRYGVTATIVNDADAAAVGEVRFGVGKSHGLRASDSLDRFGDFAYVLVSEGIGCALFVNGKPYLGGGAAGHVGRMTIDPAGPISETFSSRGPLESYASREAISRQIVTEFRSAKDKALGKRESSLEFNRVLAAVRDLSQVSVTEIATAVADEHPLAVAAVDEAARYLGIAIGALMTIMNPPTVILGGDMIQSIPRYFSKAIEAAERFTWSGAWNNTILLQAQMVDARLWGAARLAGEASST